MTTIEVSQYTLASHHYPLLFILRSMSCCLRYV